MRRGSVCHEISYHVPYTCNVSQKKQPSRCCETLLLSGEDGETVGFLLFFRFTAGREVRLSKEYYRGPRRSLKNPAPWEGHTGGRNDWVNVEGKLCYLIDGFWADNTSYFGEMR